MRRIARHLDPVVSLEALKGPIGMWSLIRQPVSAVGGRCLWMSDYARRRYKTPAHFEAHGLLRTRSLSAAPSPTEWAEWLKHQSADVLTDAYVCSGTYAFGSGRSVLHKGLQIKGVGRTLLAPQLSAATLQKSIVNHDGRCSAVAAFDDIVKSAWIAQLLDVPTIPNLALLLDDDGNLLLVREGSPVRLGHLVLMQAQSIKFGTSALRRLAWSYFFNDLHGVESPTVTRGAFRSFAQRVVSEAMRTSAGCRVFGVTLTDWLDNSDLFSRHFDGEIAGTCFVHRIEQHDPLFASASALQKKTRDPRAWIEDLLFQPKMDRRLYTLKTVRNALTAIDLFHRALFDEPHLDAIALERLYERHLVAAVGRLIGDPSLRRAGRLRRRIGAAIDLRPGSRTAEFRFDVMLELVAAAWGRRAATSTHSSVEVDCARELVAWASRDAAFCARLKTACKRYLPLVSWAEGGSAIEALSAEADRLGPREIAEELPRLLRQAGRALHSW